MGDGMMAEFGSVVDAVECAVALQRGLSQRNSSLPEAERIEVRIGVNLGDVIVEGDDRYGDGVNIAARLEQIAEPGAVYVSGKVVKEVERRLALGFRPVGSQKMKNLAEPVEVYRVIVDGTEAFTAGPVQNAMPAWLWPAAAVLFWPSLPSEAHFGYPAPRRPARLPCNPMRSHCPTNRRSPCCPSPT